MKNILLEKFTPILLIITIALAFGFGVLWQKVRNLESSGTEATAGSTIQTQPSANINIKDVDTKDEPFIGKADAPVVVAYWTDYQCPFCKKFETNTLPTLIEKYVNTGKLKIVFKDFQFLGSDSQTAGLFEQAVWETSPESFLKWQEAMFTNQDAENGGWGSKDDIIALTKTISGIDTGEVLGLMESNKNEYQKELDDDKAEGGKFGISGTPGFVIGKQSISGAQPLNVFTQIIDAELSK